MAKVEGRRSYLASRRWTETEAEEALAALERSGLGLRAFAKREGLDPQRLDRWRRRGRPTAAPVFHEVVLADASSPARHGGAERGDRRGFEVVLVSGRVVRVPEMFEPAALRQLLAVVEEEPC